MDVSICTMNRDIHAPTDTPIPSLDHSVNVILMQRLCWDLPLMAQTEICVAFWDACLQATRNRFLLTLNCRTVRHKQKCSQNALKDSWDCHVLKKPRWPWEWRPRLSMLNGQPHTANTVIEGCPDEGYSLERFRLTLIMPNLWYRKENTLITSQND